jgi:hypothetical protein
MSKPLFNACFVDGVKHTLDRIVYSLERFYAWWCWGQSSYLRVFIAVASELSAPSTLNGCTYLELGYQLLSLSRIAILVFCLH